MPDELTQQEIAKLKKRVGTLEEDFEPPQDTTSIQTFNKFADFRDALKIPNRGATPATCRIGQVVEVLGAFYACTAADTWTAFGGAGIIRYIFIRVLDSTTSVSVSTTVGGDFEIPSSFTITAIGAYVDTAGTTGTMTIDVNLNGTTVMTTNKITIDSTEKSSRTAATAPVLTTTTLVSGDLLTVDIDAIHTTAAKGLTIRLTVTGV